MSSERREEDPMTAVMPDVDRLGFEVHGWVPSGVLTAADVDAIDLDVPFEIQDGELLIMAPPSVWHDAMSNRVRAYLEPRCASAVGDTYVAIGHNARRPDIMGLSVALDDLLDGETTIVGADVVEVAVEVISHSTDPAKDKLSVTRDREVKFREYAAAGIPEYWIVDRSPDDKRYASVEIYRLQGGSYVPVRVVRLSQLLTEKP